jgi:aminoglycoside phosphotransferase (APT) family kinase protein
MNPPPSSTIELPWHDAHPLEARDVAAILARDLPEFRDAVVAPLGDGWDFKVFLVDGRWAFRFPKRRQCARALEREITLLDALATSLRDAPIDIPRYRYRVARPQQFPLPYAGYRLLPGAPLVELDVAALEPFALGAELGELLHRLQNVPALPAPRIYRDHIAADLISIRAEFDAIAHALPSHIARASQALLTRVPAPDDRTYTFQHGDLGAEHILIDSRRIAAVIDWGDAGWGHPVNDLVGLWAWGGDAAVAGALATWQRALNRQGWARLRLRGAAYAIGSAYYGYKDRRDHLYVTALGWLQRMYRAGQLFDPETPDV